MTFSGACDAVSRHDQSKATGQSPAHASQAGVRVVGVALEEADLGRNGPKAHVIRDQEAVCRCSLDALASS